MLVSQEYAYTERERELLNELTAVCNANHIEVQVNPSVFTIGSPAAVDVEHDEQGNLVGIGVYDGLRSYYFTQVTPELKRQLES